MEYHEITYPRLGLAALLMLINGGISLALRLGIERRLLLASTRMVGQLLLIGLILEHVFAMRDWRVVAAAAVVMVVVAGVVAVGRNEHPYPGILRNTIASIWASSWFVMALALTFLIPVEPWHKPQYTIPLLGMILGNSLTALSLGLDRLGQEFTLNRGQIETMLALGATRWEAARDPIRKALRAAMGPTLNTMMVAGVVSLPGMMTGQILAGVDPFEAVKYQIVIFFLVAASTGLGTLLVALLTYRALFNNRHQFLHERMR